MKQDRFQKMVHAKQTIWLSGHVSDSITAKNAVKLLRRQHAAMVRMVKQQRAAIDEVSRFSEGRYRALDDLLTALASYKKGMP